MMKTIFKLFLGLILVGSIFSVSVLSYEQGSYLPPTNQNAYGFYFPSESDQEASGFYSPEDDEPQSASGTYLPPENEEFNGANLPEDYEPVEDNVIVDLPEDSMPEEDNVIVDLPEDSMPPQEEGNGIFQTLPEDSMPPQEEGDVVFGTLPEDSMPPQEEGDVVFRTLPEEDRMPPQEEGDVVSQSLLPEEEEEEEQDNDSEGSGNYQHLTSEEKKHHRLEGKFERYEDDFDDHYQKYKQDHSYKSKLLELNEDLETLLGDVEDLIDDVEDNENLLHNLEDLEDDIKYLRERINDLLGANKDPIVNEEGENEVIIFDSFQTSSKLSEQGLSWSEIRPLLWLTAGIIIMLAAIIYLLAFLLRE